MNVDPAGFTDEQLERRIAQLRGMRDAEQAKLDELIASLPKRALRGDMPLMTARELVRQSDRRDRRVESLDVVVREWSRRRIRRAA